jgi:hypothetical protein
VKASRLPHAEPDPVGDPADSQVENSDPVPSFSGSMPIPPMLKAFRKNEAALNIDVPHGAPFSPKTPNRSALHLFLCL